MTMAIYSAPQPPQGMQGLRRASKIIYLVRRRFPFPAHLVGKSAFIAEEFREVATYLADRSAEEKLDEAKYRAELETLSDGALSKAEAEEMARVAVERLQAEQTALEASRPWNLPPARVCDFAPYVDFPQWTIGMSVALLLERDPNVATWEAVNRVPESDFTKKFVWLKKLIVASIGVDLKGQPQSSPPGYLIDPHELLRWAATKTSVTVPPALREEFEKRFPDASASSRGLSRSATRISQSAVGIWYAKRWDDRVKEGLLAPSREVDFAALKAKFAGKATRQMLDRERDKHPELKKPGRGRSTAAG